MSAAHRPDEIYDENRVASLDREDRDPTVGPRLYATDSMVSDSDLEDRTGLTFARCIQRFVAHLRQSKLVQWLVAYLAVAWLTLQLIQTLSEIWDIPIPVQRGTSLSLGLLFLPVAVIAWFHGEQGRQRICAWEITLVGSLLALSGALLWHLFLR